MHVLLGGNPIIWIQMRDRPDRDLRQSDSWPGGARLPCRGGSHAMSLRKHCQQQFLLIYALVTPSTWGIEVGSSISCSIPDQEYLDISSLGCVQCDDDRYGTPYKAVWARGRIHVYRKIETFGRGRHCVTLSLLSPRYGVMRMTN